MRVTIVYQVCTTMLTKVVKPMAAFSTCILAAEGDLETSIRGNVELSRQCRPEPAPSFHGRAQGVVDSVIPGWPVDLGGGKGTSSPLEWMIPSSTGCRATSQRLTAPRHIRASEATMGSTCNTLTPHKHTNYKCAKANLQNPVNLQN